MKFTHFDDFTLHFSPGLDSLYSHKARRPDTCQVGGDVAHGSKRWGSWVWGEMGYFMGSKVAGGSSDSSGDIF